MNKIRFTLASANKKTGPIPTSISDQLTCPDSCPFKSCGCYAKYGPLKMHWDKVNQFGLDFVDFCKKIASLPRGQLWRHNVAGDLPGLNETIDGEELDLLVRANVGKKGFTYTHKWKKKTNHKLIKWANFNGFTINLSANNLRNADELVKLNIGPVTVVLPSWINLTGKVNSFFTPAGNKVVICPATYMENVTCQTCKLCQRSDRTCIVGFPSHGTAFRKMDKIVTNS